MRKKKFYKKHKIAIILGLLATANLSIIGFATFGVSDTIVLIPDGDNSDDVQVNVGEVIDNSTPIFKFTSMTFTPFKLHTDGFYDDTTKTLSQTATLKIETKFENPLPAGTNFEISLHNKSKVTDFDFFACLKGIIILKAGLYETSKDYKYENNTLTYSNITGATIGINNITTGSLNFEFTFTVTDDIFNSKNGKNFYKDVFKKIHKQEFKFTLSMKGMQ